MSKGRRRCAARILEFERELDARAEHRGVRDLAGRLAQVEAEAAADLAAEDDRRVLDADAAKPGRSSRAGAPGRSSRSNFSSDQCGPGIVTVCASAAVERARMAPAPANCLSMVPPLCFLIRPCVALSSHHLAPRQTSGVSE
jgi:hypothetical protein